jgi:hypothetical protein
VVAEAGDIEGLLDSGGESGATETNPGGADALAMAIAVEQARHDPELSRKIGAYVDEQRVLVRHQIKHFDEERLLAIAAAKRKRISDRLRISLQFLLALIAAVAIIGFAALVWSAITDRGIVIDAAAVPADLAERGFTGEVIAKEILDRLAQIDASAKSARAPNTYANSWGGDIKLQIPETGVSIGELSRTLHERLGHATHVGCEVTHSGNEVSVSIRVGDEYAVESAGQEVDLKALVQDAATKIYARTQPYRYGYWLLVTGNTEGAAAVFRELAISGVAIDRIWALHGLALTSESIRKGIAFDQQVLDLDPSFFLSRATMSEANFALGHDELGLSGAEAVIAAEERGTDSGLSHSGNIRIRARSTSDRQEALGDYLGLMASAAALADVAEGESNLLGAWRAKIRALIYLHDLAEATNALELLRPAAGSSAAWMPLLEAQLSAERGDWQAAIVDTERARTVFDALSERYREQAPVYVYPLLAEAYAHAGRDAEADAVLAAIPADAYDGYRARGRVALLRRNYTRGETALIEAVREGPSIPRAYLDWGDLLAAKGDITGALMKYAEANRRGPHWADPLKAWGDLLARQGKTKEALAKYDQALKYAPNWKQLHEAREATAKQRA